jgi:hypothetical protein
LCHVVDEGLDLGSVRIGRSGNFLQAVEEAEPSSGERAKLPGAGLRFDLVASDDSFWAANEAKGLDEMKEMWGVMLKGVT